MVMVLHKLANAQEIKGTRQPCLLGISIACTDLHISTVYANAGKGKGVPCDVHECARLQNRL